MKELRDYLEHDRLLVDLDSVVKIKKSSTRYLMLNRRLYRRGFSAPFLRCLTKTEATRVLIKIYVGSCGSHIGGRSFKAKILRAGYYWPNVNKDSVEYVRRCDKTQRFANICGEK